MRYRMNRNPKLLILYLIMCLVLCGCGQGFNEELVEVVRVSDTDDSVLDDSIVTNNEKVDYSFSFGVSNYDQERMEVDYYGGEIRIEFEVEVDEKPFECGPMIFIDGIIQPYKTDLETNYKCIHSVKVKTGKNMILTYLTPKIDQKIKKHRIQFLLMFEPNKRIKNNEPIGHAYKITQLPIWRLELKNKKTSNNAFSESKIDEVKANPILTTDSIIDEYKINVNNASFYSSEKKDNLVFIGGERTKYRISRYVDGDIEQFPDGSEYIDVKISSSEAYILNLSELKCKESSVIYYIALPLSHFDYAMTVASRPFIL